MAAAFSVLGSGDHSHSTVRIPEDKSFGRGWWRVVCLISQQVTRMDVSPCFTISHVEKRGCHAPYLVPQETFRGHFKIRETRRLRQCGLQGYSARDSCPGHGQSCEKSWMPRKSGRAFFISAILRGDLKSNSGTSWISHRSAGGTLRSHFCVSRAPEIRGELEVHRPDGTVRQPLW